MEKMTNIPLPRIDEECVSVFSGSITNEEMLDYIGGDNSLYRKLEFGVDSVFDTDMGHNHVYKTSSPQPDHYMLEDKMVHATSTTMTNTDCNDKIIYHHTNSLGSNDDDSILISSDYGSEDITKMEHPGYYAAITQDALTANEAINKSSPHRNN